MNLSNYFNIYIGLLSVRSGIFTVDTYYLYPNMEYEFKLYVSDGSRSATALQTLYVVDGFIPDVYLKYVQCFFMLHVWVDLHKKPIPKKKKKRNLVHCACTFISFMV